jgi:hypothetical protein
MVEQCSSLFFGLLERICNFFASVNRRDENKQRAARNDQPE